LTQRLSNDFRPEYQTAVKIVYRTGYKCFDDVHVDDKADTGGDVSDKVSGKKFKKSETQT
jgi:hypothetical protein